MSDSNSSVVSIVAILAIVLLVGGGLYFLWSRSGGGGGEAPVIEVDIDEEFPMSSPIQGPEEWRTHVRLA